MKYFSRPSLATLGTAPPNVLHSRRTPSNPTVDYMVQGYSRTRVHSQLTSCLLRRWVCTRRYLASLLKICVSLAIDIVGDRLPPSRLAQVGHMNGGVLLQMAQAVERCLLVHSLWTAANGSRWRHRWEGRPGPIGLDLEHGQQRGCCDAPLNRGRCTGRPLMAAPSGFLT